MSELKRTVNLLSGYEMPIFGIGTYQMRGPKVIYRVLNKGLKAGYRSIDTALNYRNEAEIGEVLKELLPKYNLRRENVFITSKLPPIANGDPEEIRKSLEKSLMALRTSYIDLYLIQWPGIGKILENPPDNSRLRAITWRTLVQLKAEGLVRSIGVSNFTITHLEHLLQNCCGIKPDVNQIECHPHNRQNELIEYCKKQGIHVQAHSPLGSSDSRSLREDPDVLQLAIMMGISPTRILLKWALKRGLGVIPKSTRKSHLRENVQLDFDLSEDQMKILSNLEQKKYYFDPDDIA